MCDNVLSYDWPFWLVKALNEEYIRQSKVEDDIYHKILETSGNVYYKVKEGIDNVKRSS